MRAEGYNCNALSKEYVPQVTLLVNTDLGMMELGQALVKYMSMSVVFLISNLHMLVVLSILMYMAEADAYLYCSSERSKIKKIVDKYNHPLWA